MCLLIYASPGSTPSKKHLRNAGVNNPDGFGFAFALGNKIVRHRSMNLDETIELFHEMRAEHTKAHAIFHARITTHGGTNIDNCHPFMVDDGIVLGHNGMLPIEERDGKSDTRLFAEEWLPSLGIKDVLDNPSEFAELEKFTRGSKLAILSVNDMLDKPVYLVNEQDGHWKSGVWYSNHSYEHEWFSLASLRQYRPSTTVKRSDDDMFESTIDDGFWCDDETGEMFEWDEKHGWLPVYNDNDINYTPSHCYTCKADFGDDGEFIVHGRYCWDCGECFMCGREYDNCYCGNYGN